MRESTTKGTTWVAGWIMPFAIAVVGCGGGPQIKVAPDYTPKACAGQRVLLVPLAVSNELGDKRTGIVLSDDARRSASEATCTKLAHDWGRGGLVCPPFDAAKKPANLNALEQAFALDAPVPATLLDALRVSFHADYALLFRPENVSSTNRVDQSKPAEDSAAVKAGLVGTAALISPAALLGSLVGTGIREGTQQGHTSNRTEINYTVSATLLDMRSGKVLKVGLNQGSAQQTVNHNLGYAEPPPVAPLLENIMVPLGEEMLAD